MLAQKKITIVRQNMPIEKDLNKELQWFGSSLGLFGMRDKDKSCFRVFIELFKSAKEGNALSSDEIGKRCALTRGTVIHHINKLMDSGIVVYRKKKYALKVNHLSLLVHEIEHEFKKACEELRKVAEEIDSKFWGI